MPEEPRSTALDPDLLTAEIGLLLDYLSGLPERILTSPQHGHLPPGCATYDEALARYFPIDEKVRRGETLPPSDLAAQSNSKRTLGIFGSGDARPVTLYMSAAAADRVIPPATCAVS